MAKKHQRPSPAPREAEAPAIDGPLTRPMAHGERSYLLQKLRRSLQQDAVQAARTFVARLSASAGSREAEAAARLAVLLDEWPDEAARALQALDPETLGSPDVGAEFARAVFVAPRPVLEFVLPYAGPWRAEIDAMRQALRLLHANDSPGAREALRTIGPTSPFADGKRFVLALAAWYAGDREAARRAFSRLRETPIFGPFVRTLEPREPTSGGAVAVDSSAVRQVRERLLGPADTPQRLAERVHKHLAAHRPSAALRELAAAGLAPSSPWLPLLQRGVAAALLYEELDPRDILARLAKALPPEPTDPRRQRLEALLLESDEDPRGALAAWKRHLAELPGLPGMAGDRPGAEAALHVRIAGLHALLAQVPSESWDDDPWGDESLEDMLDDLLPESGAKRRPGAEFRREQRPSIEKCLEHLEHALRLAPEEPAHWRTLVAQTKRWGKPADVARVLERFVTRLPEHPEALAEAARDAVRRGAFDKARGYLERLTAAEPLNRGLAEMEGELLLGKARKQARAGKTAAATALVREVLALTLPAPSPRLEQLAQAAGLAVLLAEPNLLTEVRVATERERHSPWLWIARVLLAVDEGAHRSKAREAAVRRPAHLLDELVEAPLPAPGAREIEDLVNQGSGELRGLGFDRWATFLERAIALGWRSVQDRMLLTRILMLVERWPLKLEIALYAYGLYPDDVELLCVRWEAALEAGRPTPELQQGLGAIDLALTRADEQQVRRLKSTRELLRLQLAVPLAQGRKRPTKPRHLPKQLDLDLLF